MNTLRKLLFGKRIQKIDEDNKLLIQENQRLKEELQQVRESVRRKDSYMQAYSIESEGILAALDSAGVPREEFVEVMKRYWKFIQWGIDWVVVRIRGGEDFLHISSKDEALMKGGDAFHVFLSLLEREYAQVKPERKRKKKRGRR